MIAEGFLGEVIFIRGNFSFIRPSERCKGRLIDPALEGGSVQDIGVYAISLATMIFGGEHPEKIYICPRYSSVHRC